MEREGLYVEVDYGGGGVYGRSGVICVYTRFWKEKRGNSELPKKAALSKETDRFRSVLGSTGLGLQSESANGR